MTVLHVGLSWMALTSLVPRPSPHVRERGSGVLSNFSYQMGRGSSMIWKLESDCRTRNWYSTTVLFNRGRCWIEWAMLLDTGRAIVQTAQLGIILHAACNAWGNAIITFFTPFDPAPCDKKSRSEHQTLFPLFGEGSGHETRPWLCQVWSKQGEEVWVMWITDCSVWSN